ncbi:response regulator [Xylophilus sp.]|uniref:response regulator n=1 Tax=Xylophilus sp. TaxID=2653893 RepID=UPI0013BAF065|nr:response regulator [Xylophilus sp.]KAF1048764.1 MAG: Response regulator SaeR [Xylophilus sp.]
MTAPAVELLVVDDIPDAAHTLAELLRLDGYGVRVATCGEEALRLIAEKRPLGVLLDVDMPGMTGRELAHRLRDEFAGSMVMVAVTGLGDDSAIVMDTIALVDDFLRKPVDPRQLRKIFRRLAE